VPLRSSHPRDVGEDAGMRTWPEAERIMRREAGRRLRRPDDPPLLPLVLVGGAAPMAAIAFQGTDPDRPTRSLAEQVVLAAAFNPTRVLVGVPVPDHPSRRRGLLVIHDVEVVPDGVIEVLRAWRWYRVLGRVLWPPVEVCHWKTVLAGPAVLAREILEQRTGELDDGLLRALVNRSIAAGHRVLLGGRRGAQW
jgi:hypothetical protein